MARVAAIGLDAADWPFTKRLLDAGKLPNLERIRALGVEMLTENDIVGKPEEAWGGFLYGKDPYNNGYWSNLTFDPATYRSYRQGIYWGLPFYANENRCSVIFDVPKSGVRSEISGIQVTSWGAHAASFPRASSPAGLLTELDQTIGVHPAAHNEYYDGWYQSDYVDELADALVTGSRLRTQATRLVLDRQGDWDFFLTVLSEPHSGGHHFWHGVDANHILSHAPTATQAGHRMEEVYRAVDESVGRILEALPGDAIVVVFSVHGMKANDSDVAAALLLPELLHRHHGGVPRLRGPDHDKWRAAGYPPVLPDPRRRPLALARDAMDNSRGAGLKRWAKSGRLVDLERGIRRVRGRPSGHRPPWLAAEQIPKELSLEGVGPQGLEEPATDYPNLWYQDAWPTMKAFALPSFGEGRIRVNLRGRERDGVVDRGDYGRTCDEIEQLLREAINPRTGKSIAAHIERTRQGDPCDPLAQDADLLITWDSAVDAVAHPTLGTIGPFPMLRMSEHSNDGFAFVSGPGIQAAKVQSRPVDELPDLILGLLDESAVL